MDSINKDLQGSKVGGVAEIPQEDFPQEESVRSYTRDNSNPLLKKAVELNPDLLSYADAGSIRKVSKEFSELISLNTVNQRLSGAINSAIHHFLDVIRNIERDEDKVQYKGISPWQVRLLKLKGMQKRMQVGTDNMRQLSKDMVTLEKIVKKALPVLYQNEKLSLSAAFAAEGLFKIPNLIASDLRRQGEQFIDLSHSNSVLYFPSHADEETRITALIWQGRRDEARSRLSYLQGQVLTSTTILLASEYSKKGEIVKAVNTIKDLSISSDNTDEMIDIYEDILVQYKFIKKQDTNLIKYGYLLPQNHQDCFYAALARNTLKHELETNIRSEQLHEAFSILDFVGNPKLRDELLAMILVQAHLIEEKDLLIKAYKAISNPIVNCSIEENNEDGHEFYKFLSVHRILKKKDFFSAIGMESRLNQIVFLTELIGECLEKKVKAYYFILAEVEDLKRWYFASLLDESGRDVFSAKESEIRARIAAEEASDQDGQGSKVV